MDNYNFTQAVASTTWTINHGLNANGIALDIIVDNSGTLEKVIPVSVSQIDVNTVEVVFGGVQSGFARLIASELLTELNWTIIDITNLTFIASEYNGLSNISGMDFKRDGTAIYTSTYTNTIFEHQLSTPWDITTITTLTSNKSTSGVDLVPIAVRLSEDGTRMYMLGSTFDDIFQYDLSVPFDITTAVYTSDKLLTSQRSADILSFVFNDDGTKLYVCGTFNSIKPYTLSTPWDITTGTWDNNDFSFVGESLTGIIDVAFDSHGTRMYVIGQGSSRVYQYALSTPYDVSTSSFEVEGLSLGSYDNNPQGLAFSADGTSMYYTGITSDNFHQFDTNI